MAEGLQGAQRLPGGGPELGKQQSPESPQSPGVGLSSLLLSYFLGLFGLWAVACTVVLAGDFYEESLASQKLELEGKPRSEQAAR